LVLDGAGNLYVTDQGNSAIRRISLQGAVSTVVGGSDIGFADGTLSAARFTNPAGIAVDGLGRLIIADTGNQRIRIID